MRKLLVGTTLFLVLMQANAIGMGSMFGAMISRSGAMGDGSSVDQTLVKVAQHANRTMPQSVDADTRLDRVSAAPGQQLIYHYTLTKVRSADISAASFNKVAQPRLKASLCESAEMRGFLKNGVTVSYLYRGSDGAPIGGVKVKPSECGYKS